MEEIEIKKILEQQLQLLSERSLKLEERDLAGLTDGILALSAALVSFGQSNQKVAAGAGGGERDGSYLQMRSRRTRRPCSGNTRAARKDRNRGTQSYVRWRSMSFKDMLGQINDPKWQGELQPPGLTSEDLPKHNCYSGY